MTKEEQRKILGNNLVALLELKGKSRKDVSDALNTSYTKVCDWTKARTYPNQHDLGRLAFYFDTTIEQLTSANAVIKENGFDPEKSTSKKKVSVIDIGTDEWVISPIDYEWVSIKHLKPNTGYLMFDVVDDMLSPIYNLGDTVLAQFLYNKPIKSDGDYLLKLKDYDSWLFIHVYVKDNGYLVAPLNNNNSKSFLPRFYTKEEFIKNAFNVHKAVRVSKNI